MYTSSDTRLEWPREGHYSSQTQINAVGAKQGHHSGPSLNSFCCPWKDMTPARKPSVGDLNRCIPHLTQGWNGLGRGHYTSRSRINARGANCGYYSSHFRAIIEVRPGDAV